MKIRGYSLPEMIVGMMLAALIVTMGLVNTRPATQTAEARGLAEELTEELKAARRLAVTRRHPVAVGFPTGNGAVAHSQSFYILEGFDKPRITGGRRFNGDYPGAYSFVGTWPVTGGHSVTRNPIPFQGNNSNFDISSWQVPHPKDYLFVFLPSGHLVTNGLPNYAGNYHILVSEGVEAGSTGSPPGSFSTNLNYFQPQAVSSVHTIRLSSGGGIFMQMGVPHGLVSTRPDAIHTSQPPPPPLPSNTNSDPIVLSATTDPLPLELPSGTSAVIPPEGYLTLRLQVAEPDGQPPYAQWSGDGAFSSKESTQMQWDAQQAAWVSEWVWTPPVGATGSYELRYRVTDGHGGVATGQLGANGQVQIGQDGLVCFTTFQSSGSQEIGVIHPDGVNMRLATPPSDSHDNYYPSWSRGGNQIACFGMDMDDLDVFESLYVVNRDGTGLRTLHNLTWDSDQSFLSSTYWYNVVGPSWSPQGTKLAYAVADDLDFRSEIWMINADGSGLTRLTSPPTDIEDYNPKWRPPLGNQIVFHRERWTSADNCDIYVVNVDGSGIQNLTPGGGIGDYSFDPAYHPEGDQIVYVFSNDSTDELRIMDADGSNKETLLDGYYPESPSFSPDGTMIAFMDSDLYVTTADGMIPGGGGPGAKIVSDGDFVVDFHWSPNSKRLVYSDGSVMYQVNVTGPLDRRRVSTPESTEDFVPAWSQ
ncbi:MAG: hypothetical protein WC314_15360 [Vulcanimicrobiota bacterium]